MPIDEHFVLFKGANQQNRNKRGGNEEIETQRFWEERIYKKDGDKWSDENNEKKARDDRKTLGTI